MRIALCGMILLPLLGLAPAQADDPGQKFFDEAVGLRFQADSLRKLTEVIELCDKALEAGMTGENKTFCEGFLASALVERGTQLARPVLTGVPTDAQQVQQMIRLREMSQQDLERATRLLPDSIEGQFLLGKLQSLPGGDKRKAVAALNAAIKLGEDQPTLLAQALTARAEISEDDASRKADYDAAIKASPGDLEARSARATFRLRQGDGQGALEDVEAALALADEDEQPALHELKGLTLASLKKFAEAEAAFTKTIEAAPGAPASYFYRARARLLKGDGQGSLDDLNKTLTLIPPQPEVLLLRAGAHQQLGKHEKALEDVDAALKLDPDMPEAIRARATLLAGTGKLSEAIGDLEKLQQGETRDTRTLLQLGMLYYTNGQIERAIETFGAILKQDPKHALAYQARADARLRTGDHAGARQDYEASLKFDADNTHILNNLAWLLATSPDSAVRNGKLAIELAHKACELTEFKQAHILSTLAAGHAETGDFPTAIKWSSKALEVGKQDGQLSEQLQAELKSYQAGKPWREKQLLDEDKPTSNN